MKIWFTGGYEVQRFRSKLSALKLDHGLLETLGKMMAGGLIDNIQKQRTWRGGALKQNAPSTSERKRKKGRPQMSLVDALHRFIRPGGGSWAINVDPAQNDVIIEPATNELRDIVKWVQMKNYVGWFGISKETLKAMKEEVYSHLLDKVNKLAR